MGYSYEDLRLAYEKLGVEKGKVVWVTGDLVCLGPPKYRNRDEILEAHYRALRGSVGDKGTIVVPTASLNLCNTDIPFDLEKTPSRMGVLTEYIRQKEGSIRSFHPFVSQTAIGRYAHEICGNSSRHPFGPETPHARMIDLNTLCISIGLHPHLTGTVIHHVEMVMGVPYRYVKEFNHPVVREGKISYEPFYMNVWYRECEIKRDRKKIFEHFLAKYDMKTIDAGSGKIYSYSMADFYKSAVQSFKNDIYVYLDKEPQVKPYTK
jgi:aminoglycoside 3-N-acetyltransferase